MKTIEAVSDIIDNNNETFAQLAQNSFSSAFITESKKQQLIDEVDTLKKLLIFKFGGF